MQRTEVGRIVIGGVYRFHAISKRKEGDGVLVEDVAGSLYRVLAFGLHGVSYQDVVIYQGVDGSYRGRWFACSLWDFAVKFRAEKLPEVPDKVADNSIVGSGV